MSSSVTYLTSVVVAKSVDDFSDAVGKLDFSGDTISGLKPPKHSNEEYKRLLKYREKLRAQHLKMEAGRQSMRKKILKKYGIKESERHKSQLSSETDEKSLLFNDEDNSQKESKSCLSCLSCCFKTK